MFEILLANNYRFIQYLNDSLYIENLLFYDHNFTIFDK